MWYNLLAMKNTPQEYFTPIQLKLPVDLERIIKISDPVYTFHEVFSHIDPKKYLKEEGFEMGRPRYDEVKLLKIVLFAFMDFGDVTVRELQKLCETDTRFLWILDGTAAPSHMTIANFINHRMRCSVKKVFDDINRYIFSQEDVDLQHIYIDGTKLTANANRYSWVWKKTCITNRNRTFDKLTQIIREMNDGVSMQRVRFETRNEYPIEYVEMLMEKYAELMALEPEKAKRGRGYRKSTEMKLYDRMKECLKKLKRYAIHIKVCGDHRNSYAKTDKDATFMRVKSDYMGNDQLLPAYNVQIGVCDEYIAIYDVYQYASDMDCFKPLMEKFKKTYGFYPVYPVADAGYGSFNNYLYCEENDMEKFMKFPMFEKETKDKAYQEDPFRSVNFRIDEEGYMRCPNEKRFLFRETRPVKGNKYGRTEEIYQCEDCTGCPYREKCCKGTGNRTVRLNAELTQIHEEVLQNLNSIHGALLRMNRSIQAEGTFGTIKWNKGYSRCRRRGIEGVLLEIGLISCGFNLRKYHLRRLQRLKSAA